MMQVVLIKVYSETTCYDKLLVDSEGLHKYTNNNLGATVPSKLYFMVNIDGVLLHYIVRELLLCKECRRRFCENFCDSITTVKFMLEPSKFDTIDYNWNKRLTYLTLGRFNLEHAMAWLSTLGGAFSALGDYETNKAVTAGKISYHQLLLALQMGDPAMVARCKLYFALSLIQRQQFKWAALIVREEHTAASKAKIKDRTLIKMCHGIWAKLQYERMLYRNKIGVK